jgi:hypothetical protein
MYPQATRAPGLCPAEHAAHDGPGKGGRLLPSFSSMRTMVGNGGGDVSDSGGVWRQVMKPKEEVEWPERCVSHFQFSICILTQKFPCLQKLSRQTRLFIFSFHPSVSASTTAIRLTPVLFQQWCPLLPLLLIFDILAYQSSLQLMRHLG